LKWIALRAGTHTGFARQMLHSLELSCRPPNCLTIVET
jgi:hypothetical protein